MTNGYWKGKRVTVTGGTGFIGSFLIEALRAKGAIVTITTQEAPRVPMEGVVVRVGDLSIPGFAEDALRGAEVVFHFAAYKRNGAIHRAKSAEVFRTNVIIDLNVLEACRKHGIGSVALMSSTVVHSDATDGYVCAKRVLEVMGRLYAEQYRMKVAVVRLENTFGPRDNFDTETGQVIPVLIRRMIAREHPLLLLGTGEETRRFVYVEDVAEPLLALMEQEGGFAPVELLSEREISIRELVSLVSSIESWTPEVKFSGLAAGPRPHTEAAVQGNGIIVTNRRSFEEGLRKTIAWYRKEIEQSQ